MENTVATRFANDARPPTRWLPALMILSMLVNLTLVAGVALLAYRRYYSSLTLVESITVPDSRFSVRGKGFTVTDFVAVDHLGQWVGNDGRFQAHDGSPYKPSLVKLSPDYRHVVDEVQLPFRSSVQGMANINDRMWISLPSLKAIASVGLVKHDIRIERRLNFAPNGLAFDKERDALIVGTQDRPLVRWLDRETGDELDNMKLKDNPDQLIIRGRRLFYTAGRNGYPGKVRIVDLDQHRHIEEWRLPAALAIEGLTIRGNDLLLTNDAYMHNVPPYLNQILRYRLPD